MNGPVFSRSCRAAARGALGMAGLVALSLLVLAPASGARYASAVPAVEPAIAFVDQGHVWTVSPDGSGRTRLTSGKVSDRVPVWSPDHATVAFVRQGAHFKTSSIYTVPAAGGAARLLYKDRLAAARYIWVTGLAYSPDGAKLAFADLYNVRGSSTARTRLVILDIRSGRTSVMLTKKGGFSHSGVTAWRLAWSPDGASILISEATEMDEGSGTWLYTIGSRATKAIPVPAASTADWAADGRSLLLSVETLGGTTIEQTKLDGTVIRTLATGGGGWDDDDPPGVYTAHYSPDGAQVVYVTTDARGAYHVWVMGADGTGKHWVTAGAEPGW